MITSEAPLTLLNAGVEACTSCGVAIMQPHKPDCAKGMLITETDRCRELVAEFMTSMSFATGHGDTLEDLLKELRQQITELRQVRPLANIKEEIEVLRPVGEDYDTARETADTRLAVGAHDALRWALGLAEQPISDILRA